MSNVSYDIHKFYIKKSLFCCCFCCFFGSFVLTISNSNGTRYKRSRNKVLRFFSFLLCFMLPNFDKTIEHTYIQTSWTKKKKKKKSSICLKGDIDAFCVVYLKWNHGSTWFWNKMKDRQILFKKRFQELKSCLFPI